MKKKKKNRSGMNLKKSWRISSPCYLYVQTRMRKYRQGKIKSTGKKRGRPPKNPCRALIPLDTAKSDGNIRENISAGSESLKDWKRNFSSMKNQTSRNSGNILHGHSVRSKPFTVNWRSRSICGRRDMRKFVFLPGNTICRRNGIVFLYIRKLR